MILSRKGFTDLLIDNELVDINEVTEDEIISKLDFKEVSNGDKENIVTVLIDRMNFDPKDNESITRLNDSIELAYRESEGYVTVRMFKEDKFKDHHFNKYLEKDGIRFEEPEPRLFSFNNPFGACEKCQGFSRTMDIDIDLVIPNKKKSVFNGAINVFSTPKHSGNLTDLISEADDYDFDVHMPFNKLSIKQRSLFSKAARDMSGLNKFFKKIEKEAAYKLHYRVLLNRYRAYTVCGECMGSRLRKEALNIKINDKTIFEIVRMKIEEAYDFFTKIKLSDYERKISERILEEIISRLKYLVDVGLTYLTLDRLSNTFRVVSHRGSIFQHRLAHHSLARSMF